MQPSSLIFVAIVAIWAAFLIQHWVRRREALATARSVDRFSEAIRLLERRPVLPSPEPRPAPERYAALPSPLVARPAGPRGASQPDGRVDGRVDGRDRATRPAQPAGSAGRGSAAPKRSPRAKRPRWGRLGRQVRGIAFLGLAVLVPITLVLSAAGVLRWTSVVVALAALALGMVMLRYAAVHERTLARVERSMSGTDRAVTTATPSRSAESDAAETAPSRATATGADSAVPAVAPAVATGPAIPAEPPAPSASAASDAPSQRASRRAAYAAYSGDGTWQPVAVPRPTYTLKARADHPQPQPAEVTRTPEPATRAADVVEPPARAVGD